MTNNTEQIPINVPTLTGENNVKHWEQSLLHRLSQLGLENIFRTNDTDKATEKFTAEPILKSNALAIIVNSLSPELTMQFTQHNYDPLQLFKQIVSRFNSRNYYLGLAHFRSLATLEIGPTETVSAFYGRAQAIQGELERIGTPMNRTNYLGCLTMGLMPRFSTSVSTFHQTRKLSTFDPDALIAHVEAAELFQSPEIGAPSIPNAVPPTTAGSTQCSRCHKYTHRYQQCYSRKDLYGNLLQSKAPVKPPARFSKKKVGSRSGTKAKANFIAENDESANLSQDLNSDTEVGINASSQWLIDSGASHHFTSNYNILSNIRYLTVPRQASLSNSTTSKITAIGDAQLITPNGYPITLKDVRLVPDFHTNIISVQKLAASGLDTHFSSSNRP